MLGLLAGADGESPEVKAMMSFARETSRDSRRHGIGRIKRLEIIVRIVVTAVLTTTAQATDVVSLSLATCSVAPSLPMSELNTNQMMMSVTLTVIVSMTAAIWCLPKRRRMSFHLSRTSSRTVSTQSHVRYT